MESIGNNEFGRPDSTDGGKCQLSGEREREALFIVVRVLHGLKSARAAFRASTTKEIG